MALERLRLIREWRRYARYVIDAVERVAPDARVYLIGSVAEGTYTALSDVDILVVLPGRRDNHTLLHVYLKILEEAFNLGLPWDYPLNLIVVDEERAERFLHTFRKALRLR